MVDEWVLPMKLTATSTTLLFLVSAACGFPRPANVGTVGGHVRGLWNGVDGVALRLQATGVDTQLTVPANGSFQFPDELLEQSSYSVTVVGSPARHNCVVGPGGTGTVGDADVTDVSVVCTGPELAIALTGPWGWTFDPSQDTQTFSGSIAVQDVALTVTGPTLTSVKVNHSDVTIGKQTEPIALPLGSISIPIELTAIGKLSKIYQLAFERGASVIEQVAYGKSSNPDVHDAFGRSIAIYGDTIAVGASVEDSNATGVNGTQSDNSADGAGAVYVFVRNGTTWTQQAYIKASNTEAGDVFGSSVALYADTLAVGAPRESSSAAGINGDQVNNGAAEAGAVYVFVRSGSTWTQQAYIKASDPGVGNRFGIELALYANTLAVSSNRGPIRDGVSGAVYVFVRNGTRWSQQQLLISPDTSPNDIGIFGLHVALSSNTLIIPAQEFNPITDHIGRGVVYVFVRDGTIWTQQAYLPVTSEGTVDGLDAAVSLAGDTLAVGAPLQTQDGLTRVVRVFVRTGTTWTEQGQVSGSNTTPGDRFAAAVALSGETLAVGAFLEDSNATGVNGDQGDGASNAGAVYLFFRAGVEWTQRAYVKASNTGAGDTFGISLALSNDTLVVSSPNEASSAAGINPVSGQFNEDATQAGAFYIFR